MPVWQLYKHVPVAVFLFALGAIVGSFINVVIYRLPAGMSVITPPSRCGACGARIPWHENLPILGWFIVRGRCRRCGVRISPQYMLIELFMALLLLGLYAAYYMAGPERRLPWWGAVGGDWWYLNWIVRTAPAFAALACLMAGLVAMTVIDARTFEIPIRIPLVLTVVAFVAWPVQALLPSLLRFAPATRGMWPMQTTGWTAFAAAAGGMIGLGAALLLLRRGVLRYSFADYDHYLGEGDVLADYPHARREMRVELAFLLPTIIGLAAGWLVGRALPATAPPLVVQALGGTLLGYLVGGGLVWAVRIAGTLGFGREAMGLGDVHLMGAVGAVLGWVDPILIFALAPFFGLSWAVLSMGLSALFRRRYRELPYGPHLAVATLVLLLCQPAVERIRTRYLPWIQAPGIVSPQPPGGSGP